MRGPVTPGSAAAWILAARPATLSAAAAPVLVGTAVAISVGAFAPAPALAALVGALAIQIGTNFANDVFDFERGADTAERVGPTRAVQAGLLSPRDMRLGMVAAFGVAALVGIYLVAVAGWPIVAIGVASVLSGIAYTGGPYPLGYHGLGDLFVWIFFGPVAVCGTTFVQAGHVPALAWAAAVPMGSIATAILAVNNLRDADTDRAAGKRTLAVRWGKGAVRREYLLLLAASYATPLVLWLTGRANLTILLPLISLPHALRQAETVWTSSDAPALNRCLKATAILLFFFGGPFALGIVLSSP